VYARYTLEQKQEAVEEYFGGDGPYHGKLRLLALKQA
jgi:hypothetical protein